MRIWLNLDKLKPNEEEAIFMHNIFYLNMMKRLVN